MINGTLVDGLYFDWRPLSLVNARNMDFEYLTIRNGIMIENLPASLTIRRNLVLTGCSRIRLLPEKLEKIGGDADLRKCSSLMRLPRQFETGGDLCLDDCTSLVYLSDRLDVGGSIYLTGCRRLKELPRNLIVKDKIYLRGCSQLKNIPAYIPDGKIIGLEKQKIHALKRRWSEKYGQSANFFETKLKQNRIFSMN